MNFERGRGKYDELGKTVLVESGAKCIAIIVIDGTEGDGFEVQMLSRPELNDEARSELLSNVAGYVRAVATAMDEDARRLQDAARGN